MAKAKKKKSAPKKGTKNKVKFNKGTPYEMEYVWVEPKKSWINKVDAFITSVINKLKQLISG